MMLMKSELKDNIEQAEAWKDSALPAAQKRFRTAIKAMESKIVSLAGQIDVDENGIIRGPEWTLKQAEAVHTKAVAVFDDIYGQAITGHVAGFQDAVNLVHEQLTHVDVPCNFSAVDEALVNSLSAHTVAEFQAIGTEFEQRIAQSLYNAVLSGQPFARLTDDIRNHLVGLTDAAGRPMTRYAETLAQDNLMQFYSSIHNQKAKDAGLNEFLYVGDVIASTRPFCAQRAGKVYTREEIESWTGYWQGKSGPAMTCRGGYHCRHHWQPCKKEWVPGGEVEVQREGDR